MELPLGRFRYMCTASRSPSLCPFSYFATRQMTRKTEHNSRWKIYKKNKRIDKPLFIGVQPTQCHQNFLFGQQLLESAITHGYYLLHAVTHSSDRHLCENKRDNNANKATIGTIGTRRKATAKPSKNTSIATNSSLVDASSDGLSR